MNIRPGLSVPLRWIVAAAVVLGLVLALVVTVWQLRRARAAVSAGALRADSLEAANDSSRVMQLSAIAQARLFADSLQAFERRAVQRERLQQDALDEATRRSSVVRGGIRVEPGRIATSVTAPTDSSSGGVRTARFHVDSSAAKAGPRFVADAMVALPPPPAAGSLSLGISLAPIVLEPRVQCGAPGPDGLRPASLGVVAPAGVTLSVLPLEADVHACNPDFGKPSGIRVSLGTAGALGLLGLVLGAVLASH